MEITIERYTELIRLEERARMLIKWLEQEIDGEGGCILKDDVKKFLDIIVEPVSNMAEDW